MRTILDLYNCFDAEFTKINELFAKSNALYQNAANYGGTVFEKDIYDHLVERCFMCVYLLWENFLEEAFTLYLLDQADMKGNNYTRFVFPKDETHAYELLKGTNNYPDWTNLSTVKTLSKLFFENSGPFALLQNEPVEFSHIKKIRNRISHVSKQSIKTFDKLTQSQIARSKISAADFLSAFKDHTTTTYYSFYTDFIKSYVEAICNK